ncbi:DUF4153 domain-containing protein [Pseudoalteromonas sp. MMG005]|uniref:DUF4153 domain-containing protein n=1 Tax=Pseudoalteromonas sp. MMG005 TaxID=2822682 RepID=UPI001B39FEA7|nr:DUF4153 domain-containing protein [Pseudoalteromonas sp. MMG005]MBQ4845443.1 DUF4153 domain-containing protein [Pseudoalteromonas sp. MMG005]
MLSKHTEITPFQSKLLLLIALLQGLTLLLLHQAIDFNWPIARSPAVMFACYTFSISMPTLLIYGVNNSTPSKHFWYATFFSLMCSGLGAYVGSQVSDISGLSLGSHSFNYAVIMTLISFKVLLFTKSIVTHSQGWRINYAAVIDHASKLAITLIFAGFFTLMVWLIFVLWAELFAVINITVFETIFYEPWFIYPMISISHALAVIKVKNNVTVVKTANRLIQALSLSLLPLLIALSSLFLMTLMVQGLQPLWDNGGSALIFILLTLILLTLNTALQNDKDKLSAPNSLYIALTLGVLILPTYVGISGYGLYNRVTQYGLSVDRLWGIFICLFLMAYYACYSIVIVKYKALWYQHLGNINTRIGVLLVIALLASQSPLLDFKKISASSQMAYINSGRIAVEDIDLNYFAFSLGMPGKEALISLKNTYAQNDTVLQKRIDRVLSGETEYAQQQSHKNVNIIDKLDSSIGLPMVELPKQLLVALQSHVQNAHRSLFDSTKLNFIAVDLYGDSQKEYLLIAHFDHHFELILFYKPQLNWETANMHFAMGQNPFTEAQLIDALLKQKFTSQPPTFKEITVGEQILRVTQ